MALQTWAALNASNAKNIIPNTPAPVGYGHQTLNAANNFFTNLSTYMASLGEGVLSPALKGVASGVRSIQATPDILSGNIQGAQKIMQEPLNMGLNSGPQPTLQGSSNTQNLGTVAQTASLLVPATELGPIPGGAMAGGLQAGGQTAENPNATAGQVGGAAALGVAGGAGLGIAAKYAPEALQKILPETKEPPITTEDTLQSRISDATPSYNKKMIGQNVITQEDKIVPRIAEENTGFTGTRPVTTSASEYKAGQELNNIKDYPDKGTNLEKSLATGEAIGKEAENMRSQIAAEDKSDPLDTKAERAKVTNYVTKNLDPEEQEKFESGQSSKTAMGRYVNQVNEAVADYNGTREGKLDLRQKLDDIYKENRGKLAFQGDSGNTLDETHTDIRNEINKDLKGSTNNIDTQASLNKQTNLYRAKDVLDEKARAEAGNKVSRFEQQHSSVKFIKRQLARRAVSIPLTVGATAAGLPLAEAAARKILGGTKPKTKALK